MTQIATPTFKSAARLALALSLVGFGTVTASAGGKSPPPAYDVTFDNVSTDFMNVLKITLPKVEVKGASVPQADIEKMFASDTPIADRVKALTAFSAGSVDIPTVTFSLATGLLKVDGSYSGNKLEKISGGKIGKYSYAGAAGTYVVGDDKIGQIMNMNVKGGKGEASDVDYVLLYRMWNDKAGPDDKEPKLLYSTASTEGMSFDFVEEKASGKGEYGKITVSAGPKIKPLSRPLKEVYSDAITVVDAMMQDGLEKPETVAKLRSVGLSMVEVAENYQMESAVVDGYTFTQTAKPTGAAEPITMTAKVEKIESKPKLIQASNVSITADKDMMKAKIGAISLKDFSFEPLLTSAKAALNNPAVDLEKEAKKIALSLYANLGTMTVSDLDVAATVPNKPAAVDNDDDETADDETPKAEQPAAPATPATVDINVKLKTFTLRSEKPVNGVPSSVRLAMDNLQMPTFVFGLSGKSSDIEMAQRLKQLGYENLDMSFAIDSSWNKDTKELAINEIKGAETNTGSILLKGTIANFAETMFTTDETVLALSALGLTAKNVSLHVDDKGGLDRILKFAADERGVTVEQLKSSAPLMLSMIPEPFASMPSVTSIKNALLQYWENPGKLDIAIKSKSAAGIGIADFMAAAKDPVSFESKLDVSATATK